MLSANPLSHKLAATAFVLAMIATVGVQVRAQDAAPVNVGNTKITGLPTDWSHRHVIYGNPGTEQDAIRNGTHEQWLRIVNDPRYVVQSLKKGQPVQGPAQQDVEMRRRIAEQEGRDRDSRWGNRRHERPDPKSVSLHRDWSMNTGGGSAASVTFTVPTPTSSITSGSSNLVVKAGGNTATITASGPTTQAGTFTMGGLAPGNTTTLTLGNVNYYFTSSTAITTPGAGNCSVNESGGRSTTETNLLGAMGVSTANGGDASAGNTWKCGSVTQTFKVTASVNQTNPTTIHTITVAANLAGATGYGTPAVNSTGFTYNESTAASDGTSDGSHFTYWNGNQYDTQSQFAGSLATSIGQSNVSTFVTESSNLNTTNNLTITAATVGTGGNAYSVASSSNAVAVLTGTVDFGGGIAGPNLAGSVYPAKWAAAGETAVNCAGDYVVYPTGMPGSASNATIIAYNNMYSSCGGTLPTVDWSYETGTGTVETSPVISYDGTKVAFIETQSAGAAVLRIVNFAANAGTDYSTPATFTLGTNSFANTTTGTAWTGCPAGSCMISVASQVPRNTITNSSPFYDAVNDVLYVGDDNGVLHKFSGVFLGTPVEVTTGGWPITLAGKLTSPVIDPNSGSLFVGSSNGRLYQITTPSGTPGTGIYSAVIANGTGIVDSPVADASDYPNASVIYVFVGDLATNRNHSGVVQFSPTFTGTTNTGLNTVSMGTGTGSSTLTVYDGDFDNNHYGGGAGNLYFCGGSTVNSTYATLYTVPVTAGAAGGFGTVVAADALTSGAATCSPATEFDNPGSGGTLTDLNTLTASGNNGLLNGAITSAQTTIAVNGFFITINNGDYILVNSEYMLVTAGGGATGLGGSLTLTVTRGLLGSTAVAHTTGASVAQPSHATRYQFVALLRCSERLALRWR